ncbi:vicilin-like seed storage protein At2g18540 [Corylus avellana]|uniref:vicilin-like seed storage protein At2g18540 n=1 Tax=Corylus avellana TaxID=13451 RepID=UPI00286D468B|nr:vicilin-like seed storage protein At2g18540 [Corylus avellana]
MEDEDKERKKQKNYPPLPSNYVTLVHLQQQWLKEKERKQRDKEEEEERQRKLELQKKLEEEQKRKLRPRGLKGGTRIDYERARGNRKSYWQPNRREVEVSPAKSEEAEVVDTVNVSAEQEQKSEESKESARGYRKSYWQRNRREMEVSPAKPDESEVVAVVIDTVNVSAEQEQKSEGSKEPARGYRKSYWQRNRREMEVRPAKPDESEVVAVVIDTVNVSAEQEQKSEGSKEPARGTRKSSGRQYHRRVEVSPAKPEESEVVAVVAETVNVSAKQEQKSKESKEEEEKKEWRGKEKKTRKKKGGMNHRAKKEEEEKKEVTDGMANAPRVISEKENAPAKRGGESKGTKSEFRRRTESGDQKAEIERRFGDLSINSGIESVNVRAEEKEEKKEATDGIGIERVNVRATRLNIHSHRVVNRGNREYINRGHRASGARWEVRNQSGVGRVWVRKGEIPDCNAGGVRSSK